MKRRGSSRLLQAAGVLAVIVALSAGGLWLYADRKLDSRVLGGLGERFSTTIFAAPLTVRPEEPMPVERLLLRLRRLSYRRVDTSADSPGEFSWAPPHLSVYLRGFNTPVIFQDPGLVTLTLGEAARWRLQTFAGAPLDSVSLEPERLAELSGERQVRREPAGYEEIPERLRSAVVAVEDKRFFSHWGVDARAIVRAALHNFRGGSLHGGSTITQQLAKNYLLTPERTFRRKLAEAWLALCLEIKLDKKQILTLYLNSVYLGQEGTVSVSGVRAAARFYFGKELSDLKLPECAMLAGMLRSPYRYNPWRFPESARGRRNWVLNRMLVEGMLTQGEAEAAMSAPLRVKNPPEPTAKGEAAYAVAEVLRELVGRFREEELFRYGFRIDTTIDPVLQHAAAEAVGASPQQAALIALDPADGAVRALSGGRKFSESQFNRATLAMRQPGSSFKPFVFGAALERGITPATLLLDEQKPFYAGERAWNPRNFGGVYKGTTTVRQALALSLNAATLDLERRIGFEAVRQFAARMGVRSPLEKGYALALGSSEVTLWELTAAYAPFANGGFRVTPHIVSAVSDSKGRLLLGPATDREPVLDPLVAFLVTSLMETAVKEGTGQGLKRLGWDRPAAGKTGTNSEGADAWFVGYTPRLLTGVWVGSDKRQALQLSGGKDAIPVWAAFMKPAESGYPAEGFSQPPGLVEVKIDPLTGKLAVTGCPTSRQEQFVSGTEPKEDCPIHKKGLKGFFRRLFGKT